MLSHSFSQNKLLHKNDEIKNVKNMLLKQEMQVSYIGNTSVASPHPLDDFFFTHQIYIYNVYKQQKKHIRIMCTHVTSLTTIST